MNSEASGEPDAYSVGMRFGTPGQEVWSWLILGLNESSFFWSIREAATLLYLRPPRTLLIFTLLFPQPSLILDRQSVSTMSIAIGLVIAWPTSWLSLLLVSARVQFGLISDFSCEFSTILTSSNFFLPGSTYDGILGLAFDSIASVRLCEHYLIVSRLEIRSCHTSMSLSRGQMSLISSRCNCAQTGIKTHHRSMAMVRWWLFSFHFVDS